MASQGIPSPLLLTGVVVPYAGMVPPSGWLECDGKAVSRVQYARLFEIIGTHFGAGDGANTFNLPDLRGEFIRGWDHDKGIDKDRKFGSSQEDWIQTHTHTDSGHTHKDDGHTHTDNGHTHEDRTGHKHEDEGHAHEDSGHKHPYYHLTKVAAVADGGELSNWDGRGNHYADDCSIAKANIQSSKANLTTTHVTLEQAHANIQQATVNVQSAQANISEPVNARHGGETRPRNVALMYIIKI